MKKFFVLNRTVVLVTISMVLGSVSNAGAPVYCNGQEHNLGLCSSTSTSPSSTSNVKTRSSVSSGSRPRSTSSTTTKKSRNTNNTQNSNLDDITSQNPNQITADCAKQCGDWTNQGFEECTQNCALNRNNNNSNDGSSTAQDAINKCTTDTDTAKNDCDQDQDDGVQGAQTTLSNFAVGMGAQAGMAAACSGLGAALAGANSAVVYFSQKCSSSRTTCMKSCDSARGALSNGPPSASLSGQIEMVDSTYKTCKNLDAKVAQATQALQNMAGTLQGATQCSKQTDMAAFEYCKSNPTAIGCAATTTDCSNPQIAASNPICICKANPNSSTCTGAQALAGGLNGSRTDSSSASSYTPNGKSGLDSDSMFGNAPFDGNGMTPSKGTAEDVGGKKGGPARVGDSGGGAGGGAGDGKGGSSTANPIAVNAGYRGGGGGGGWNGSSGYNNEGGGGGGSGTQGNGPNGPNLRDFLPNGKLDPKAANRGLAGISGPDGITGPHSDIWKKIQNRYQVHIQNSTLMP